MPRFDFRNEPIVASNPTSQPALDVRNASPQRNFGCGGKARAINEIYNDEQSDTLVWQPDVLWEARRVAEQLGLREIVDIGCGNGDKLIHHFGSDDYHTLGIDFQGSLATVRRNYPDRIWKECNLASYQDLGRLFDTINIATPKLIVLSDVLEHLSDPLPVLAFARKLLLHDPRNRFFLTTPDRLRQGYLDANGIPENRSHTREWTLPELEGFMLAAGFQILRSGHTRANQFDIKNSTLFVELACSAEHYAQFLQQTFDIPLATAPKHLLITSEYANFKKSGGMGAFVREQRETYGMDNTLCLFTGALQPEDMPALQESRLLSMSSFLDPAPQAFLPIEDQVLQVALQLLFFLPQLETIQYGDYQGLGCRIAQAKRSHLLPGNVKVVAHCHGATHYLENANQNWYGISHFGAAEKEKISVELADMVTFPTNFLEYLYAQAGIVVPREKSFLVRYPYHRSLPPSHPMTTIDTIVFYGKQCPMKGYSLFLRTVLESSVEAWIEKGIKTLCFIGSKTNVSADDQQMLETLRQKIQVEEYTELGMAQAMTRIHSLAHHSLCLMPYLADNHPYALLDAAFSTALPVMVRGGGAPEMYPVYFRDELTALPTPAGILNIVWNLLDKPIDELQRLRESFLQSMIEEQIGINERFGRITTQFDETIAAAPSASDATIIVPVFNTALEYIEDLITGINYQTLQPKEVIFIDDASESAYSAKLAAFVPGRLKLPYRIIRHPYNKGLAGARNTGLQAAATAYVLNIDSDDVPMSDFVRDIVRTLDASPNSAAALPYLAAFDDGEPFNVIRHGTYTYRPIGDGVIASQLDNQLGHANAGYRVEALRRLGGWDETSKAMWEDYALYLRIVSAGLTISIIPKEGCLYRVRTQSMLRTYEMWPAMRRLANNMLGLPRYENFRLQAALRSYRDATLREVEMTQRIQVLEQELQRTSVRVARLFANRAARHLRAMNALKKILRPLWRLLYRNRHLFRG